MGLNKIKVLQLLTYGILIKPVLALSIILLAKNGQKQFGGMTSSERGYSITMIDAINAGGGYMHSMLIFPCKNFKDFMIKGAPEGTLRGANPSAWLNENLFLEFMKHFVKHTCSTIPTILLLDNHERHPFQQSSWQNILGLQW